MAEITKSSVASLVSTLPPQHLQDPGLLAGETIAAWDACYIKASDGKVYKSTGAAANAAAKVHGFAMQAASAGEAVTLIADVIVRYGSALSPGANLFLSGTVAGGLADAASTGGTSMVGYVENATNVRIMRSRY